MGEPPGYKRHIGINKDQTDRLGSIPTNNLSRHIEIQYLCKIISQQTEIKRQNHPELASEPIQGLHGLL